jgi:hypothetical protein
MQAIVTKFLGPTDHRGSRVKATCQARSLTLSWDHRLNPSGNHLAAAKTLALNLGWGGRWIEGGLPTGESVFVLDTHVADTFTLEEEEAE